MRWKRQLAVLALVVLAPLPAAAVEHSVARQWNEVLLNAIRKDFARPTVHSRNLFHISFAMYDAWAAYDDRAQTYMLGRVVHGFNCPFYGIPKPADVKAAREKAISYASYRLIRQRFLQSPGAALTYAATDNLMQALGYDPLNTSTDYQSGDPAALGNYIAQNVIAYGLQDKSNQQYQYENLFYEPLNPPLTPTLPGDPTLIDMNHWQPLTLDFIDQSGNHFPRSTPAFVGAEWGSVYSFSLNESELDIHPRDGFDYWVFHDPGPPPLLDTLTAGGLSHEYKWSHQLVSIWQSHLDPTDGVIWDVSPASIGNNTALPATIQDYPNFYKLFDGGDQSRGYTVNPRTGLPYTPQHVPRGDYARCLAEFWADGPNSETPPGHWFTILNYVTDHPLFPRRFEGEGPVLDLLEWDVKAYFTLGGTVHDAAIAAWGVKGWYDYIRPISAIRCMARYGQHSDPSKPRYHPCGVELVPGYIEMVTPGDTLAGPNGENVDKIKLYTWRAHDYIPDPLTTDAGVGWILADNWWPYQRPTFVTPPFAGYVSGHSTFSRAAAEVMGRLTGDEYFPGGMGEFFCPKNEFLVFEDGPSVDVTLQWAKYIDASDQCSLSRIWGGIHPPADDIPGRKMGIIIGPEAFAKAKSYFEGKAQVAVSLPSPVRLYPNPPRRDGSFTLEFERPAQNLEMKVYDVRGRLIESEHRVLGQNERFLSASMPNLDNGLYFLQVKTAGWESTTRVCIVK